MTQRMHRQRRARLHTESLEQRLLLAADSFAPNVPLADSMTLEHEPLPVQYDTALLGSPFSAFTSPLEFSPSVSTSSQPLVFLEDVTTYEGSSLDIASTASLSSYVPEHLSSANSAGVLPSAIPGSTFAPTDADGNQPSEPRSVDRPTADSFTKNTSQNSLEFDVARGRPITPGDSTAGMTFQYLYRGDSGHIETSLPPTFNGDVSARLTVVPADPTDPVVSNSDIRGSLNDPFHHEFSAPSNLGFGTEHPNGNVGPAFEVAPNRTVITPPRINEFVSATELLSFATIDIAPNRMPDRFQSNSLAKLKQEAPSVGSSNTTADANEPRFHQSAVVSFRVEPIMARHHHIDLPRLTVVSAAPVDSHRATNAATPRIFEVTTIDDAMIHLQNRLTANIAASLLFSDDADASGQEARTSAIRPAAGKSVVPSAVATEARSFRNVEQSHSNWQMAIDALMAGVAGAVIYSGQYQDRRHRDGELEPS